MAVIDNESFAQARAGAGGSDVENAYLALLRDILENGAEQADRTGVGTMSVFGRQLRCDLSKGFPLLTTKKVHFKSIAIELLWFLRGDCNLAVRRDCCLEGQGQAERHHNDRKTARPVHSWVIRGKKPSGSAGVKILTVNHRRLWNNSSARSTPSQPCVRLLR